jgi:thiamine transport system substrate-binding protein
MKAGRRLLLLILLSVGLVGCDEAGPQTLTLMTHDSFAISESVLGTFEAEHNVVVEILPAGDAGTVLNQAILSRERPLADLLYGVDNTFLSRALEADLFVPYASPALEHVAADLVLDTEHRLTPVDYGDVCLNYDLAWFETRSAAPPASLEDLVAPAYENLTAVQNPATSSPGLAFLLTTIAAYGEDGYLDYWRQLRENGVLVTSGWEDAYYGQFSAAGEGSRPIVVSYASSPPAEVLFGELDEAITASVTAPGTCFRQVEFVGILKGTEQQDLAEAFVDFMLSETFQADIPLNMFVFPARGDVQLPEVFVSHADIPAEPVLLADVDIAQNRERWIEAWTDVVLR